MTDLCDSKRITTSQTIIDRRSGFLGFVVDTSNTAGNVSLRNGGPSGEVRFEFDTPNQRELHSFSMPAEKEILFDKTIYAEITNVTALTVVYEEL